MSNNRKVVCIAYETGSTVKRNGKTYPETKLLTVGSAFVNTKDGNWRINGQFRAIPPIWDGRFVILDPLPRQDQPQTEADGPQDEEVPY